jgi:prepilin-type N-terminal cleavage/methylation domain-containing protein
MANANLTKTGFTLVEISLVLVIIGLLIGGVVVGRDLMMAANTRAQISQIEKFRTAMRTFQLKYAYLPGDIPDSIAIQYEFLPRGGCNLVDGSGDGIINTSWQVEEPVLFWDDLLKANLLDTPISGSVTVNGCTVSGYGFPAARMGDGNYVYVYEGGQCCGYGWGGTGINYFGVSAVTGPLTNHWILSNQRTIPVQMAYNIDQKADAMGFGGPAWAGTGDTSAMAGSATTCYDNNGTAGIQHYSTQFNNGTGQNCALSFQFH